MKTLGEKGYLYSADGEAFQIFKTIAKELENIYSKFICKLLRVTLDTNPEDCNLSCTQCAKRTQSVFQLTSKKN